MDIIVMNKNKAEEYAIQNNKLTSIIISITSHGGFGAFIIPSKLNGIIDVLHLKFNDTDNISFESGGITTDEAIKIKEFVNKYKDNNVDRLIVHCEAGQSRSAGVAAAIMKYLYNDDTPIFNNNSYTPNMLCYRKVLNTLMQ